MVVLLQSYIVVQNLPQLPLRYLLLVIVITIVLTREILRLNATLDVPVKKTTNVCSTDVAQDSGLYSIPVVPEQPINVF